MNPVHIPASVAVTIYRGFTFVFEPTVKTKSGDTETPYDFTGCTATYAISRNGQEIASGPVALSSGAMVWRITDVGTETFDACEARYIVAVTLANGDKLPFFSGIVKIVDP